MKKLVAVIAILAVCSSFAYFGAVHPKTASADGTMQEAFVESLGGAKDEEVSDMALAKDGGYYLHCFTRSFNAQGWDFLDVKVDSKGRPEWAIVSGGAGDEIWNMCHTYSNGIVFIGNSTSYSKNTSEILCKVNKEGHIEWSKSLSYYADAFGFEATVDNKDNIFNIFNIYPTSGRASTVITSFTPDGTLRWAKEINLGQKWTRLYSLTTDDEGNVFAAGYAGYNPYNLYFIKMTSEGKVLFCKRYAAVSQKSLRLYYGIAKVNDGFILSGTFNDNLFVMKVDQTGSILWAKTLAFSRKISFTTLIGSKYGIVISGMLDYPGNAKIVNVFLNPDGTLKWAKTFGGDYRTQRRFSGNLANCPTLVVTGNGSIAFSNYCTFGNTKEDLLLVKTDSNGDVPGCKYIQDEKVKVNDVTKEISAGNIDAKTVASNFHLTVKDVDLHPRFVSLSENKVCQPKPEKVVLLSPKDKSSSQMPVTLKWQDTPNADTYEVQLSSKSDFSNVILDKVVEEPSFTVPTDKIEKGKTYYWRVRGINALNKGDWSEIFSFSTIDLPSKPSVSVSLSNGGATLSWEQVKQGTYPIKGYAIYRGEEQGKEDLSHPIATVDANTTQYTDKTVEVGKTYYYIVKAFDDQTPPNYSKPSNEVSIEIKDTTPPTITINSPEDGAETSDDFVSVSGIITDDLSGIDSATINGNSLTLNSDGSFSTTVSLTEGDNTITITATDKAGNKATKTITVTYKPKTVITLQPNNPMMTVNGIQQEIDPGRGTKPVIIVKWSRTVVPIRAIVEALGGTIEWDGTERKVTINFNGTIIELWIDKPQARVNGEMKWIDPNNHDVKPIIINSRTMLPLRFVAENLGCTVQWDAATRTITITYTP